MSIINYWSGNYVSPAQFVVSQSGYNWEDDDNSAYIATNTYVWDSVLSMLEGGETSINCTEYLDSVVIVGQCEPDQNDQNPWLCSIVTDADEYYNGDGDFDDGYACRGSRDLVQCDLGVPHYVVSGSTYNSIGVLINTIELDLFDSGTDTVVYQYTSGSSGDYSLPCYYLGPFYVVAYQAGSPDIAGTTVNTLVPTPQ